MAVVTHHVISRMYDVGNDRANQCRRSFLELPAIECVKAADCATTRAARKTAGALALRRVQRQRWWGVRRVHRLARRPVLPAASTRGLEPCRPPLPGSPSSDGCAAGRALSGAGGDARGGAGGGPLTRGGPRAPPPGGLPADWRGFPGGDAGRDGPAAGHSGGARARASPRAGESPACKLLQPRTSRSLLKNSALYPPPPAEALKNNIGLTAPLLADANLWVRTDGPGRKGRELFVNLRELDPVAFAPPPAFCTIRFCTLTLWFATCRLTLEEALLPE
eukprot:1175735-Prorocentrum_minimum.AAC.1